VIITEFAVPTSNCTPYGITRGPDGNLWFAELNGNQIGRITPAGVVTEFSTGITPFSNPYGITAGPDGNLWFTEFNGSVGSRIGRITPAGVVTEFSAGITAGSQPTGITAGPDGNLWFTEQVGHQVGRITPQGTITEFSTGITAGSELEGITPGPDGNLWFAEFLQQLPNGSFPSADRIGRITPSGTVTEFSTSKNSENVDITAGPDGNLWFTESGLDQIGRITPSGTVTEFVGLTAGSRPFGITAGPDGNLWFAELNGGVGRINPTTHKVDEFVTPTANSSPFAIVTGPDGNLWFTESNSDNAEVSHIGRVSGLSVPVFAVGADAGGAPEVKVYDAKTGTLKFDFLAYDPLFRGGVRVAVGDVNGDGPGGGSHVKVIDGTKLSMVDANGEIDSGALLGSFYAYDPAFPGGLFVAFGVSASARPEIVTGADAGGGPHVKVIDGTKLSQTQANGEIADSALLGQFYAFDPAFTGGVSVAAADLNNDGVPDIVAGAGPGGGPHVKVIDGSKLSQLQGNAEIADSALLGQFYAYSPAFVGGVYVAADVEGSAARIATGAGAGNIGPRVRVIDASHLDMLDNNSEPTGTALVGDFLAYDPAFAGGVRVAAADLNGDGVIDILTGAGPGGGPHVKAIDGTKLTSVLPNQEIADSALLDSFFALDPGWTGGVFVGAR
jgi:streptogramin lyase